MNGIKAFLNPLTLVRETIDFLQAWSVSRPWISGLFFAFPFATTSLVGIILFILGASETREGKLNRYLLAAEKAAPIKATESAPPKQADPDEENATESPSPSKEVGADAILYFRRILELENENKRARYYVAVRQESQGALAQARRSMATLAPSKVAGYEPAHAWLAVDMLRQASKGIGVDQKTLEHHLSVAANWNQVPPRLLFAYAEMVARKREENWQKRSLDLIQKAATRDRSLLIAAAQFARALGNGSSANAYAERAVLFYSKRLAEDEKNEGDRLNLALAHVQREDLETAKKSLLQGIAIADSGNLRRLFSEICIEQYKSSLKIDDQSFSGNWGFLDQAIAYDPLNPKIGEQIAILMDKEITLSAPFREALQKQLGEGKASPLTYLILGILSVKKKDPDEGKKYLELAYNHAPYSPLIINNFAMVHTMIKPPDPQEALRLVDAGIELYQSKKVAFDRNVSELYDSRGRILLLLQKPAEATKCFDDALRIDPNREDTRLGLIEAYKLQGLPEMVDVQQKALDQLRAANAKKGSTP